MKQLMYSFSYVLKLKETHHLLKEKKVQYVSKGASVYYTEKHYFEVSALLKAIKINPR